MLALIGFYQRWVSPLLPPRCRFTPTCSAYAAEAIEIHGFSTGCTLAVKRICKCHPFHAGGFDPVPATRAQGCAETSFTENASKPSNTSHNSQNQ